MVLADALQHLRRQCGAAVEDVQRQVDVFLDQPEFGRRQQAGLFQQGTRDLGLAHVGQHADLTQVAEFLTRKAQVPAERHEVQGHTHAVVIDLDVLFAQSRDPHHGIGVVQHAVDHAVDGAGHGVHVQGVAVTDVFDQCVEGRLAGLEGVPGARQFRLHGPTHFIAGQLDAGGLQLGNLLDGALVLFQLAALGQVVGDPEQHPLQHPLVVVLGGVGGLLDHLAEALARLARDTGVSARLVAPGWPGRGSAQDAGPGLLVFQRLFRGRGRSGAPHRRFEGSRGGRCRHAIGRTVCVDDGCGRRRGLMRDGIGHGPCFGGQAPEIGVGHADVHGHAGRGQFEVDVNVVAVPRQGVQLHLVVDQEPLQQEGRVEPRPIQLHDEHVQSQILDGDPVTAIGRHRRGGRYRLVDYGGQGNAPG